MRVGILTQPFLRNYGGILQNWALQQTLQQLGHDPLTLEHDTCCSRTRWLMRSTKMLMQKRSVARLPEFPYKGRIGHHPFVDFIDSHIKSAAVSRFSPHIERRHHCQAMIVGSDQVWRPVFNQGWLYNMYLDFTSPETKRIAYAASFGVSNWEYSKEETMRCRELAQHFHAVSVREDKGIALCRRHLGIEATMVSDPTLLLDEDDYKALCANIPEDEKFMLIYALHLDKRFIELANDIAKKHSLRVRILQAGNDLQPDDSIEKWIASFRDAQYVVTDSFHGIALSIIFNKPFLAFSNETGGQQRIASLLSQYGLSDRAVEEHNNLMTKDIDWETLNTKRKEMKASSIAFLTNALA